MNNNNPNKLLLFKDSFENIDFLIYFYFAIGKKKIGSKIDHFFGYEITRLFTRNLTWKSDID